MLDVNIYDLGYCDESQYTRVVCVCRYKDKFLFSYNEKRKGWEIPGGHIEDGESWKDAFLRSAHGEGDLSLIHEKVYKEKRGCGIRKKS